MKPRAHYGCILSPASLVVQRFWVLEFRLPWGYAYPLLPGDVIRFGLLVRRSWLRVSASLSVRSGFLCLKYNRSLFTKKPRPVIEASCSLWMYAVLCFRGRLIWVPEFRLPWMCIFSLCLLSGRHVWVPGPPSMAIRFLLSGRQV